MCSRLRFGSWDHDGGFGAAHVIEAVVSAHGDGVFFVAYRRGSPSKGKFEQLIEEAGPGISAPHASRGVAFGDFDNDGDVDILVLNMNEVPSLLRNDGGNKNNWINIKLLGTVCNRTAIGARVRVVVGRHAQMDEVHRVKIVIS